MKFPHLTGLFGVLFLTTGLTAYAQQGESPLRYQALEKIDRLRAAQGDNYQFPASDSVTSQQPIPLTEEDAKWKSGGKKYARLLSDAALDRFFANQTVRYLTGKTDLSYYNTYFTASSSDGSFNLGRTITRKSDNLEQVLEVANLGFKTNLLNGLGNLFSERNWNREVGGFLNHTWLQRGSIWFDKGKGRVFEMDRQRAYLRRTIKAEIDQKISVFDSVQRAAIKTLPFGADKNDFQTRQQKDRDTFVEKLTEEEVEEYLKREELAGKKLINYAFKSWITMRGSISGTSYRALTSNDTEVNKRNFVPFKLGLDYSFYAEDFRKTTAHRLLVTASASIFNTNKPRILERYGKLPPRN